ncbi:NADH dehydrogenase [ubiquinone] flavoprotein 3, mitochondrial isoform X1 [Erythrolamprus reginae]
MRSMPSIYLCTKPGGSKKGFPKDKGKVISNCKPDAAVKLTEEDLRKFLARKTLVMFPQKAEFPFERKPVFSSTVGKRLTEEQPFSSSSSESDSSSDSEDDDLKEKPHRQKELFQRADKQLESDMIKTASQQRSKEIHFKSKNFGIANAESQKPIEVLSGSQEVFLSETDPQKTQLVPPQNISQKLTKKPIEVLSGSQEVSLSETDPQKTQLVPPQNISQNLTKKPIEVLSGSREVSLSETDPQKAQLVLSQNISQNLEKDENNTKKLQKTEMQKRIFEEPGPEVSGERMPVIKATTLKEEIIPEVEAQIEEESTPEVATLSPETAQETHDTSTYKNLQHHEYQPFTFVDFDVLLSKFRLPQPSSGRLSPRH